MEKILDKNDIIKIAGIIGGAILFHWILQNMSVIMIFLQFVLNAILPFLLGLCIAFILNIPMGALENRLFKKMSAKVRRLLSLLLTILLAIATVVLVMFIVIPEIKQTFEVLAKTLPGFIDRTKAWGEQLSAKLPNLGVWLNSVDLDWDSIKKNAINFLQSGATGILSSTVNIATSLFSSIYNSLLGLVFAIYILIQKETLARHVKKLLYAFLPETRVDRIIEICSLANKTFSKFVAGQCIEAVILGLMFFASMTIFRFPYALVVGLLVTFTALIPIFGAFIACIVGAFLILLTNPGRALWFVVLFLVLQQIEGNLIYPRVVGKSVGLPALWVMTAVIVGGSMMGIIGMLVSVPLSSVLYALLGESIARRLKRKRISPKKIAKQGQLR